MRKNNDLVILGGSFNPPHKAHKKLLEILIEKFDKVIVVPCGTRPDKPSANIIPIGDRMRMVNIAFGKLDVTIDFYDFVNETYTPTYLLQERYEMAYPQYKIWHVIGEDIIAGGRNGMSEIHKVWDFGDKIWNDFNFLVVVRPGYDAKSEDMPPHSTILEIGDIIGSGTLVRKRISENRQICDLVEPEIDKYIKANSLYRSDVMYSTETDILIEEYRNIKDRILKYKYPEELFETLDGDLDEKLASLKKKFRALMFTYGADRFSHYNSKDLTNILSEITRKVIEFEALAEKAVRNGTYGEKKNGNGSFIVTGKYEYVIDNLDSQSDFFETFSGTYADKKNKKYVCMKVARIVDENGQLFKNSDIESNNELIQHEINTLKHLDSIKDKTFQKVRKQHFPVMIDDLRLPSGYVDVDIDRRALVTEIVPDTYDFVTLKQKFPDGVPLYHGCWILARILSAAGHLHFNNMIHGNIHPEGIFVNPQNHNVTLADLEFSIIDYTNPNAKYIGTTEHYSAPEVYQSSHNNNYSLSYNSGNKQHPRTDIYSIGMSMIYLLGGDIEKKTLPDFLSHNSKVSKSNSLSYNSENNVDKTERERGIEGIRNLILSMVAQHPLARSDDAWKLYHQLQEKRILAFGEPQFVEFKIK